MLHFSLYRDNEYGDETSDGGAAFIILTPRNLNGHATIPAPPESASHLSGDLGHSKWSVNSTASIDGGRPASIDLEWENDGKCRKSQHRYIFDRE